MTRDFAMPSDDSWHIVARRAASGYFAIQSALGAAWWLVMILVPRSRGWFLPSFLSERLVPALLLPDVLLYVMGSCAASIIILRSPRAGFVAACVVAAVAMYATLFSAGLSLVTNEGWLGTVFMVASALMSCVCVWLSWSHVDLSPFFRKAPARSSGSYIRRTFFQAVLFWGVLLFFIPAGLSAIELRAGIPTLPESTMRNVVAVLLFTAVSSLGLTSAFVMAIVGRGTPVPLESPNKLVTSGPYRYVRNPMAIAGLLQGFAVALWLGSGVVVIYVIAGMLIWHVVVRPLEEHDLHIQFGQAFDTYRANVRCWFPQFSSGISSINVESNP